MSIRLSEHIHGITVGAVGAVLASFGIESFLVMGFILKVISICFTALFGGFMGGIGQSIWNYIKAKLSCKRKDKEEKDA